MQVRTTGLLCGLVVLLGLHSTVVAQQSRPKLPKSHRHIGVDRSATGDAIPEFAMTEATLEAAWKKENLIRNRSRKYDAFIVSGTRLFVTERKSGKSFEIRGLPLEWRPFSDLTWADDRTLMFDRWSQPHYGVHYAVDIEGRRLVAAVPFPDKIYLEQQRQKSKGVKSVPKRGSVG